MENLFNNNFKTNKRDEALIENAMLLFVEDIKKAKGRKATRQEIEAFVKGLGAGIYSSIPAENAPALKLFGYCQKAILKEEINNNIEDDND